MKYFLRHSIQLPVLHYRHRTDALNAQASFQSCRYRSSPVLGITAVGISHDFFFLMPLGFRISMTALAAELNLLPPIISQFQSYNSAYLHIHNLALCPYTLPQGRLLSTLIDTVYVPFSFCTMLLLIPLSSNTVLR